MRFLKNEKEKDILEKKSGYVWRWNAITGEFENLEALTLNNSAFCSIDMVNDLRGKSVVAVIDTSVSMWTFGQVSCFDIRSFEIGASIRNREIFFRLLRILS